MRPHPRDNSLQSPTHSSQGAAFWADGAPGGGGDIGAAYLPPGVLIRWWTEIQHHLNDLWRPSGTTSEDRAPGWREAENALKEVKFAMAASITADSQDNPVPALLRSYRLWTRAICEMGRRGWPGVDWTYLEQVV